MCTVFEIKNMRIPIEGEMINVEIGVAGGKEASIGFKGGSIARERSVLIFASFKGGIFANDELGVVGECEGRIAFKRGFGIEDPVFGPTLVTPVLFDILCHITTENGGAILEVEGGEWTTFSKVKDNGALIVCGDKDVVASPVVKHIETVTRDF